MLTVPFSLETYRRSRERRPLPIQLMRCDDFCASSCASDVSLGGSVGAAGMLQAARNAQRGIHAIAWCSLGMLFEADRDSKRLVEITCDCNIRCASGRVLEKRNSGCYQLCRRRPIVLP